MGSEDKSRERETRGDSSENGALSVRLLKCILTYSGANDMPHLSKNASVVRLDDPKDRNT